VCATFTLVDGLVIARAAFSHSMNYRSAVVYGAARHVGAPEERDHALGLIVDHIVPGRTATLRANNRKELAATTVLAISLSEASVKVRQGPPSDDEPDHALDVWAGVLPVHQAFGPPRPDPLLRPGIPVPGHIAQRVTS
jgi:nitroimidazol reductase NimA-like FMN-containing flavoprotein (pyridoxamine 5'-phosphate oxidase superfamily)